MATENTEILIKIFENITDMERILETAENYDKGLIPEEIAVKDIIFYLGLINKRHEEIKKSEAIK